MTDKAPLSQGELCHWCGYPCPEGTSSRSLDRERLIRVMLAEISRQIDVYGDVRDEVALADAVLASLGEQR